MELTSEVVWYVWGGGSDSVEDEATSLSPKVTQAEDVKPGDCISGAARAGPQAASFYPAPPHPAPAWKEAPNPHPGVVCTLSPRPISPPCAPGFLPWGQQGVWARATMGPAGCEVALGHG